MDALDQALPRLVPLQPTALPPEGHFHELRQRIASAQLMARDSGALHAALYVDGNGKIALCREDIGRHNALDKLIGALTLQRRKPSEGFVVVTSRCSLELIHKAVRAGIGTLVSLSAPTQLTVQWARQHHLNLIHLPHHSAPRSTALRLHCPTRTDVTHEPHVPLPSRHPLPALRRPGWRLGRPAQRGQRLARQRQCAEEHPRHAQDQPERGFDCPGCAWGDSPDAGAVKFCENGAKAVNWEATRRRVDAAFFAPQRQPAA